VAGLARYVERDMNRPGNAAVLSLIIPGVGQIYNGDFLRGIFWLIITPGFWIGTGGTLGWICHLVAAYTAYNRARRLELAV
jgi:TM2 domain-containing membrane protein YozV